MNFKIQLENGVSVVLQDNEPIGVKHPPCSSPAASCQDSSERTQSHGKQLSLKSKQLEKRFSPFQKRATLQDSDERKTRNERDLTGLSLEALLNMVVPPSLLPEEFKARLGKMNGALW